MSMDNDSLNEDCSSEYIGFEIEAVMTILNWFNRIAFLKYYTSLEHFYCNREIHKTRIARLYILLQKSSKYAFFRTGM